MNACVCSHITEDTTKIGPNIRIFAYLKNIQIFYF